MVTIVGEDIRYGTVGQSMGCNDCRTEWSRRVASGRRLRTSIVHATGHQGDVARLLVLWIDRPLTALSIAISFGIMRAIMGGVHASTFGRCVLISSTAIGGTYGVSQFLAQWTGNGDHSNLWILLGVVIIGFGLWFVVRYVPVQWGARNFTSRRIQISKWMATGWLFLLGIMFGISVEYGTLPMDFAIAILLTVLCNVLMNLSPLRQWIVRGVK
jgi:accessory gene regulator protein AgrB